MMSRKSKSEGKCEGERFVWGCKEGKVPQSREGTGVGRGYLSSEWCKYSLRENQSAALGVFGGYFS